jgi:Protein of unknown function (DUF1573)/Methylamine utilisation protein MauE
MFGAWAMRGLGGLLLLAAALKMYGLAVEPVGRAGMFSAPWVQTLIVEWEIALAVWFLSGVYPALAWLAGTATFLAFAGFSFWQGWIGQTSCGCFGAIRVDPWLAFGIDVVALVLLALARHRALATEESVHSAKALRPVLTGACGVLLMLGVLSAIGTAAFGSPAAALAYLRGQRLSVEPRLVDVGEGYLGEQTEILVRLRNWTEQPIRVVGGSADCSCVVTDDLPTTVEPGATSLLKVRLQMKAPPGQFTRLATLYTDDERFRVVTFRVTGHSRPYSEE